MNKRKPKTWQNGTSSCFPKFTFFFKLRMILLVPCPFHSIFLLTENKT